MPRALWQVLYARGLVSREQVEGHFSPKLKDLTPPTSLTGIDKAVARLISAFEQGEVLCIYADFDLDGTPGLALLHRGLTLLGFKDVRHFQPKRLSDGYGLHAHVLKDLKDQGVQLVVTVDVGITDVKAVSEANEIGLDVIITDHHLPKEELPAACAIVNPNQSECESGLGHLSGTGVAFYLVLALRSEMHKRGLLREAFDPKELLDCFAIGTVTDMVPLIKENRSLVKHGLVELSKTKRPGLKVLLQQLDLWGRSLSSQDVGFKLAPKLNALSRLEKSLLPIDLFLVDSEMEASRLVGEVFQTHQERVELQRHAEKLAEEVAKDQRKSGFIWVWSPEFHQGIVGLVATKMAQKFKVPAFIGAGKEDGRIVGSARIPDENSGYHLPEALGAAEEALEKFGGHKAAAGFELRKEDADLFEDLLRNYFKHQGEDNKPSQFTQTFHYDSECGLDEITPQFMSWYENMGPYGMGFEAPVFLLKNLEVTGVRELRGGHLKLSVRDRKSGARADALWFSPPPHHPATYKFIQPQDIIDILGEPEWNHFAGKATLQVLVKDLRWSR
ncbi:MAG: single-stranded-DNA-specific exonuclease RecJ [Bdellovibrionales bacterium]|nr:single-stranded-DNA-specific exonuclease RecJ [Bdellovibrionales bacterium]